MRFILAPLLLPTIHLWQTISYGHCSSWGDAGLNDDSFTEQVFTTEAASKIHCAQFCIQHKDCVGFTSYPGGTSLVCSGYASNVMTSAARGVRRYIRTTRADAWLGLTCASASDCKAANSECFAGKCLCNPGFLYSLSGRYCLPSCSAEDLQDSFVSYPASSIEGFNLEGYYDISLDQCRAVCLGDPRCVTMEYTPNPETCNTQAVTAAEAGPPAWQPHQHPGWTHYMRTCA